ncbi:unnamed protein product [Camellia sinensis]
MAPAKKMRRLPPPKRALLEPYSPSTDTCIPYPKGLAADGFKPIGPSLSQINVLSGSETIAPSPSQTNAPHGFEICEASPSETHAPSPQSQTSGVGASSSRRVRGPTVGKATAKRVANNNGNKLHIPITEIFNAFEGVLVTPGANEIGIQIRRMCPIQGVKNWIVADLATKGVVVQAVRDKFEIGDNYEDNALSQEVVEKKCNVLHKDWKCRMKKKWEKLVDAGTNPYAHPYKGIKLDDWKYLIDEVWLDPVNKVKKNGGLLPDLCNFYKDTHQNKKTKQWIDPICGANDKGAG